MTTDRQSTDRHRDKPSVQATARISFWPPQLVPALARVELLQAVHYRGRYTAVQVQLLCTYGANTLHFRYTYSTRQVQVLCTSGTCKVHFSYNYIVYYMNK